jgi:hypothetical protein
MPLHSKPGDLNPARDPLLLRKDCEFISLDFAPIRDHRLYLVPTGIHLHRYNYFHHLMGRCMLQHIPNTLIKQLC